MKTTWKNRPNVCGLPGKIICVNGASALISAKLYPISSKAKTPISASTSNGLREAHRRWRGNYKEFKEFKEFKNRSQGPGGSSRPFPPGSPTPTPSHTVQLTHSSPH